MFKTQDWLHFKELISFRLLLDCQIDKLRNWTWREYEKSKFIELEDGMKRITHWKFQKNTEVQNQALKTMELTKQNISIVNDVASIWVPPLIKSSFNLSICPSSFTFTSSSRTCSKSFSFLSSFCFIIPSNFLVTSIRCSMFSFLAELSIRRCNSNILLSCQHCFFCVKKS